MHPRWELKLMFFLFALQWFPPAEETSHSFAVGRDVANHQMKPSCAYSSALCAYINSSIRNMYGVIFFSWNHMWYLCNVLLVMGIRTVTVGCKFIDPIPNPATATKKARRKFCSPSWNSFIQAERHQGSGYFIWQLYTHAHCISLGLAISPL